jgi:hypothetical protein
MRYLRVWPVCALAALAVFSLAGCSFGQDRVSEPYHTSIDKAPTTVEVHNAIGEIEIDAWDKPSVEIDAEKRAMSLDDVHRITVSVEQEGPTLVVTSHFPSGASNCRVDYTIHAPATANLDLEQSVGAIESKDFAANVRETTKTGAIATTMASLGNAQNVTISVGVGAIGLDIPATSSASFSASTSIGAITADFPLSVQREMLGSSAHGSIGKGDARVDLSISTGAIAVKRE